jgi:hypothetical protein
MPRNTMRGRQAMRSRRTAVTAATGGIAVAAIFLGLSYVPIRIRINSDWVVEVVRVSERTAHTLETATPSPLPTDRPASPTATGEPLPAPTDIPTATPSRTPTPTVTPSPTPCLPDVTFVEDVTIPDDTVLVAGQEFEKIWRLRSSGCAPWSAGTRWTFVFGEQMGAPAVVEMPQVVAGETVDVVAPMVAPGTPGTYKGFWQMRTSTGVLFGDRVYVQIVVVEPTPAPPSHLDDDGGGSGDGGGDHPGPRPTRAPPPP